jgi:molybdopterin synthase sulfur carrier subunit
MILVRYFASLREQLGCDEETLELPPTVNTLGELRGWLAARDGPWREALGPHKALRGAIDQKMQVETASLRGAREVAFFPPVTGG